MGNSRYQSCRPGDNGYRRKRGVALLLALFAVAIAAILALSFLSAQSTSIGIARNIQNHSPARYVAESGLELAIAYVRSDVDWRTNQSHGTWVTNEPFADGTFTIVGEDSDGDLADDSTDLLTLTVTGTVNGAVSSASHIVQAVVTPGGSRVDYDYAARTQGTDIFAYSDADTGGLATDDATPGGPSTVLTALEYDDIEADDGAFFNHAATSNNQYVRHRFEFLLDEAEADVTRIDVTWSGKGVNENNGKTDGAAIYIWKYSGAGGSTYQLLVAGADTESPVTLAGSVTSDLPDYIGPGTKISVLAVSADKKSGVSKDNILYTDYVSITVYTGSGSGYAIRWLE